MVQASIFGVLACLFVLFLRSLCALFGGIGRLVPYDVGANQRRLRRIGWERCGHGLTSSPRESVSEGFLDELLLLFRCSPRSAPALLEGTLPLRYCAGGFAGRIPTWRLPAGGHAAGPVTEGGEEVGIMRVEHCSRAVLLGFDCGGRVDWISGVWWRREKSPTKQKNSCTPREIIVFWGFSLGRVFGRD